MIVLRVGFELEDFFSSRVGKWLTALHPVIPRAACSCFLPRRRVLQVAHALGQRNCHEQTVVRPGTRPTVRIVTLLGENRRLADICAQRFAEQHSFRMTNIIAHGLRLCAVRVLATAAFHGAKQFSLSLRSFDCKVLEPTQVAELLELFHSDNRDDVVLAGYNTGMTHFGWKYPRKTILKTVGSGRLIRVGGNFVDVDAGVTLKEAADALRQAQQGILRRPELLLYRNGDDVYGAPFMGRESPFPHSGETIEKIVYYDASDDCIHVARAGDAEFHRTMYHCTGQYLGPSASISYSRRRRAILLEDSQ